MCRGECVAIRRIRSLLAVIALCVTSLPRGVGAQLGYPYDRTEHGGRDANGDGTTGAQRPANQPIAGYTVDSLMFESGACVHCHDQHASLKNVSHLPNQRLVFTTPENQLCATCHDRPNLSSFNLPGFVGWAGAQRSSFYAESKHGKTASGVQWVAGNSYGGIANVLNNNLTTPSPPPGAGKVYDKGSCLTCHSSHGYYPGVSALVTTQEQTNGVINDMLSRTMGSQAGASPAESNALCHYCHDNTALFGSGGDHSLISKSYWYKGSQSSTNYSGYNATPHKTSAHTYNLWPGTANYPARGGEKGQCFNCHDPHGGAAGGNVNGAAGGSTPSNRMLVAPMIDPNQPTTRNALCFTCHNNISGGGAQKFLGQTLYQVSKHGSSATVYWGRTSDVYDNSATSYNPSTAFWGPRSTGDYGLCLNCHNPHTKTIGTVSVNGSTTVPKMLLDSYHNGNSKVNFGTNNSRLCFDCHNADRLTNESNLNTPFRESPSGKNLHGYHMNAEESLCNDCHNPHGYNSAHVMGSPPAGARNISFNTANATQDNTSVTINGVSTRGPVWFYNATVNGSPNRYGCVLRCHGEDHGLKFYTPTTSARLVQLNYRWYFDNSATDSKLVGGADANIPLTQAQLSGFYRLRVQVGESNNALSSTARFKLQYSSNGGSSWSDVGAQDATAVPWRYANSPNVTDKNTIGTKLLPSAQLGSDNNGAYVESKPTNTFNLQNQSYEFDCVIEPVSGQVQPSATYLFRIVSTDAVGTATTPLQRYDRYATLTTASQTKGYFAGSEGVRLFSDSDYGTEIYPQFTLIAAGATVYVEAVANSDGAGGKTVMVKDHNNNAVSSPVALTRSGFSSPYTYRAALTLPATSNQQYYLDVSISGSSAFRTTGPLLTVGTTNPTYYCSTYSDNTYQTDAEAYFAGDTVYVELGSGDDGTPSATTSAWQVVNFQGNIVASGSPDTVSRVTANKYRMTFLLPPLTAEHWFSLRCTVKDGNGVALAQGPCRLIKQSVGRQLRQKVLTSTDDAKIKKVVVSPQPTRSAKAASLKVRVSLDFGEDAPPIDEVEYTVDSTNSVKRAAVSRRGERENVKMGEAKNSAILSFDFSASDWTPRSSHAVFVRTPPLAPPRYGEGLGERSSWTGTMVSVTPSDAEPVCLTYYLDEECSQPAPTPNGTPVLPRRGTVYLKLHAPHMSGFRLNVDAPGELNDMENDVLRPLSATEAVAAWTVTESSDTLGRAQVVLTTPDGRAVVPSAGAFAFIGESPRANVFFELSATPDTLDADGKSTASITAKVTDANGQPLPSRAVDFRRLAGGGSLLPQSPATDSKGEAKALYLAGVTAETAEVEVIDRASGASARIDVRLRLSGSVAITLIDAGSSVNTVSARLQRRFQSAAERLNVILNAYPRRLPADGVSTANLVATVTDGRGLPKAGVMLRFEVADYNGQVIAARPLTDATGRAEAVYVAGRKPGDITLIASDPMSQATGVVTLTLTGSGVAKVVVEATPNVLPADGRSLAHVTVRVTDLLGRPVSGASVQLRTRSGYGVVAAGAMTTNTMGEALAAFRSGQMTGVETIIATVVSPLPEREGEVGGSKGKEGEVRGNDLGFSFPHFSLLPPTSPYFPLFPLTSPPLLNDPRFGFNPLRLPAPVTKILNNLSMSYGRWDEYLTLEGPQVESRTLHLKSNSWNFRFKRPMSLGFGGLSFLMDMNNSESEQYGIFTRSSNMMTTLRASGRRYDFMGNFVQSDTEGEDLRSGIQMRGNVNTSLLSVTLRPPRLPVFNVSHYRAGFTNGTDGSAYGLGFSRTTMSLYQQIGNFLDLRWTHMKGEQNQGGSDKTLTNTFGYNNVALTVTKDFGRIIGVGLTLNRTGTRASDGTLNRVTNQTDSSFQLRLSPSPKFVVTGTRASNDVEDTALFSRAMAAATQSVDVSYQPARFLSLQAGMRSDDQQTLTGISQSKSRNLGGMLTLMRHSTLSFNLTHSEQPELLLLQSGQQSDGLSVQLTALRVLPNTDLLLGWMKLRSASLVGTGDTSTYTARIQTQFSPQLRASLGMTKSNSVGENEGLGFAFANQTRDVTLLWSPNQRTEIAYIFTRATQAGREATSDNILSALRLSTVLRGRAFLVVEAANNVLNQSLLLPGGFGQDLKGSRFSARFNYAMDANSYVFLQLEKSQDDISHFRTRSLRMGYTVTF